MHAIALILIPENIRVHKHKGPERMMEHFFPFDKVFFKPSLYSRHWLDTQRGNSINNSSFHCPILDPSVTQFSLSVSGNTKDQVVHTGPPPI